MTTIILTTDAVNALFPEGSEARIELQKTVLRKLADQYIKDSEAVKQLKTIIAPEIKALQDKALADIGIRRRETGWSNSYQIDEPAKTRITGFVREAVEKLAWEAVNNLDLKEAINTQVTDITNQKIREGIRARLTDLQRQFG